MLSLVLFYRETINIMTIKGETTKKNYRFSKACRLSEPFYRDTRELQPVTLSALEPTRKKRVQEKEVSPVVSRVETILLASYNLSTRTCISDRYSQVPQLWENASLGQTFIAINVSTQGETLGMCYTL